MENEAWHKDRDEAEMQGKRIVEQAIPWRGKKIQTVGDRWYYLNMLKVEVRLVFRFAQETLRWWPDVTDKTRVMLVGGGLGRLNVPYPEDTTGERREEIRLRKAWIESGPRERLYFRIGYGLWTDVLAIDKDSFKRVWWEEVDNTGEGCAR